MNGKKILGEISKFWEKSWSGIFLIVLAFFIYWQQKVILTLFDWTLNKVTNVLRLIFWLLILTGVFNQMHNYYGSQVWQMASFLIGGSIAGFVLILYQLPSNTSLIHLISLIFFGSLVSVLAIVFLLMLRRHRGIAEVHLIRCRRLEEILGIYQHNLVWNAQEGINHDRDNRVHKIEKPSGWQILTWMSVFIIIFPWILICLLWLFYQPLS